MTGGSPDADATAEVDGASARALLAACRSRGWTLGVAESLTGGLVAARLVDVPGASDVLRGGVVAYATDLKSTVLHVDPALLAARGPVDADVALQMADGVRALLHADVGLATTGVAGPDPQDGVPAGTVHVAVVAPHAAVSTALALAGPRDVVRRDAARAVLALALDVVAPAPDGAARG